MSFASWPRRTAESSDFSGQLGVGPLNNHAGHLGRKWRTANVNFAGRHVACVPDPGQLNRGRNVCPLLLDEGPVDRLAVSGNDWTPHPVEKPVQGARPVEWERVSESRWSCFLNEIAGEQNTGHSNGDIAVCVAPAVIPEIDGPPNVERYPIREGVHRGNNLDPAEGIVKLNGGLFDDHPPGSFPPFEQSQAGVVVTP